MERPCNKSECTVAQTGKCLLNNDAELCPERILPDVDATKFDSIDFSVSPLKAPARKPQFPSSLTLTPDVIREAAGGRYFHLIGILGAPDAGKTAILVSLYLLLSHGLLEEYEYADSLSLMAFDEISRGARRWNDGAPPVQMTNHTELLDDRTAGFLHFRLQNRQSSEAIDILFPDLPGEWSNSFIDTNRTDRLDFLKSADAIWLTIDGRELIAPVTRQHVIHRASLLMHRLSKFLSPDIPPVYLVISHKDVGSPSDSTLAKLEEEARSLSLPLKIIHVSSFSDSENIKPGTGINELIMTLLASPDEQSPEPFWPDNYHRGEGRQILKFRLGRTHL